MNYFTQINKPAEAVYPAVTLEEIKANWNKAWSKWHSPDWETKGRPTRDDKYLREAILSQIPVTKNSISIPEALENWHNATWWQENLNNIISIIDNMYVKKSVKAFGGIYSNWLTRFVQFVNTYIAERTIKEAFGFIWNEVDHTNIHSGTATSEECKPDFIAPSRETVELKLCENEQSIINHYFKNLREDFEKTKEYDFHNADIAMFCTKSNPSIIYTMRLDKPESLNLEDKQDLKINLIPTENGKIIGRENNPNVPLSLLFGLTPRWQHK